MADETVVDVRVDERVEAKLAGDEEMDEGMFEITTENLDKGAVEGVSAARKAVRRDDLGALDRGGRDNCSRAGAALGGHADDRTRAVRRAAARVAG